MILERESWPDVEDFLEEHTIALLPVGSTEQHGPHAPLNTDSLIAKGLVDSVANCEPVLAAPTVRISVSSYHGDFPGTLWVSPSTFRIYIKDVVESLISHGIKKIVLVNGHGGNRCSLEEVAIQTNEQREGVTVIPWTWFDAIEETVFDLFNDNLRHADGPETSVIMYLDNELIHEDRLEWAQKSGSKEWRNKISGTSIPQTTSEFTQSGAIGFPETASAKKGEKLFQKAKEDLQNIVKELS